MKVRSFQSTPPKYNILSITPQHVGGRSFNIYQSLNEERHKRNSYLTGVDRRDSGQSNEYANIFQTGLDRLVRQLQAEIIATSFSFSVGSSLFSEQSSLF